MQKSKSERVHATSGGVVMLEYMCVYVMRHGKNSECCECHCQPLPPAVPSCAVSMTRGSESVCVCELDES